MDNLFGVSLTSIMAALLIALAGIAAVLAWIAYRNPILVRLGLRNIGRRPAQTTLIVFGLMLATLLICASFATGDTITRSIDEDVFRTAGHVDIVVEADPERAPDGLLRSEHLQALQDALADMNAVEVTSPALRLPVAAVHEELRRADAGAELVGLDPDTIRALHGLETPAGKPVLVSTLEPGHAFVTDRTASLTEAAPGSTIAAYLDNVPHQFQVAEVVRSTTTTLSQAAGVEGPFEELSGRVVTDIATVQELAGAPGAVNALIISLEGHPRATVDAIPAVEERIERVIDEQGIPAAVTFSKARAVAEAELIGSAFTAIFLVLGLFSIAAGILLIFLIFVMLAAERRSEMGISRAIGMKRLHLTETFLAEGMAYNLGAALVGALLGLAVAYALLSALLVLFGDFEVSLVFRPNPRTLVVAYGLGVVITFLTVTGAAWRAAHVTVASAVRDLPEPPRVHARDRRLHQLGRSVLGAAWYPGWVGLITLWVVVAVPVFFLGLATYGAALVAGGLTAGLYVYGVVCAQRPFADVRGWRRALYLLWWVAFSAVALVTWVLFRTRGWAARHRDAGGWAVWMIIVGALLAGFGGWSWGHAAPYQLGITLAALGIAVLGVHFGTPARPTITLGAFLLLVYWALPLPFSLFTDFGTRPDPVDATLRLLGLPRPLALDSSMEMFFVSGIAMVTAATLLVVYNADILLKPVDRFGGMLGSISPAIRMAVAYPLAARARTGLTVAMFSLVVLALTFVAFLGHNFSQFVASEEARAGFDVVVTGNEGNRIEDLRATLADSGAELDDDLTGVGHLIQGTAGIEVTGVGASPIDFRLRGLDDEYLALTELPLDSRAAGYETDAALFEAMRGDPTLAVANTNVLRELAGAHSEQAAPVTAVREQLDSGGWEPLPVTLTNPATGELVEVRLIAILSDGPFELLGWRLRGLFVHETAFHAAAGEGSRDTFFAVVPGGSAVAERVASEAEFALLERGVTAASLDEMGDRVATQFRGMLLLFEGFMGLGLIVGMAALGVIAFRAVVERRQQIGMLRAIGYSRRLVITAFFFEWSFIALTGIVVGVALGASVAHTILVAEAPIDEVAVPWLRLFLLGGIAYGASALMTLIPARAASRLPAAEALRYE